MRVSVDIPIEDLVKHVNIGFSGELVDTPGDFYYKLTAHTREDLALWQHAAEAAIKRRIKNARIVEEIRKESMEKLGKSFKKRRRK